MKASADLNIILNKGLIENESEFEQANIIERKLRLLSKKDVTYHELRQKLRKIIADYETQNWIDVNKINLSMITENDEAEKFAEMERSFIEKRKKMIKMRIKEMRLKQCDLAKIMGHKSNTYMSELINGIYPFTLRDLTILAHVLKIELSELIPGFLSIEETKRIETVISSLNQ
jgi:hypothetical protein